MKKIIFSVFFHEWNERKKYPKSNFQVTVLYTWYCCDIVGTMTILSQQYGNDNGDNRKDLKSIKNSQKNSEKPQKFNFLPRILKKWFLVVFGGFWDYKREKWNFFEIFFHISSIFSPFLAILRHQSSVFWCSFQY